MMRLAAVAHCVLFLALALWARPVSAGDDAEVFERLRGLAQTVETIQSDFVQEKHLSVFRHVMVSSGRFLYRRPDNLRWEYTEQARRGFSISGGSGRQWDALAGVDRPFSLADAPLMRVVAGQLLSWAAFDLPTLREQYAISVESASPVRLRLEPLGAGLREFLSHLSVEFADDARSVRQVVIHECDGDFTRLVFSGTVINAPLPEGRF